MKTARRYVVRCPVSMDTKRSSDMQGETKLIEQMAMVAKVKKNQGKSPAEAKREMLKEFDFVPAWIITKAIKLVGKHPNDTVERVK